MKRKLLSLLVLLMTAETSTWATEHLYLDIPIYNATSATLMYGEPYSNPYYDNGTWSDMGSFPSIETLTVDGTCVNYRGTTLNSLFRGFINLTTINNITRLYTVNVTNMGYMFEGCTHLTTITDIKNMYTLNVEYMNNMFQNCSSLESLDLSGWGSGTSKVKSMGSMFQGCSSLTSLKINNIDTSSVTDMSNMFFLCSKLSTLDLGDWNTANVTTMYSMFNTCSQLSTLTLGAYWNTENVTNMYSMFYGCSNLGSLNASGWNTGNVTNMSYMFNGCSNLSMLNASGWDTSSVTDMSYIFSGCWNLESLYISSWDTSGADKTGMFSGCTKLNRTVTANGETGAYWATFYSNAGYNLQAPDGTQVFKVSLSGTKITMTPISDGIVNNQEGVVLKSTSSSITLTPSPSASADDYSGNDLEGTATTIPNPGDAYVLNRVGEHGVGFYKLSASGTIGANKAYLTNPGGGSGYAREFFLFDDDADGIGTIQNSKFKIQNEDAIYNLAGQRIQKMQNQRSTYVKGINIVNGKKIIM